MTSRGGKGGGLYLGIEIGGTKLQIFAGNGSARIQERISLPVNKNAGAKGIRRQLEQTVPVLARRFEPAAVGVGFGGPVDWRTGRICRSHQIEGWPGFPLAKWLSGLADAPVRMDNDANVGAFGEALHGAGKKFRVVFYVTLGSGVGGGLVADGKIYHGATPGESEIGHVRLDRDGTILENRCSGWAVDAKVRAAVLKHPKSALARAVGSAKSCEAKFLTVNDPLAKRILTHAADDLAFGLSHVTQLFHPEIIVLGGGLSLIGEPLRAAVEESLRRYTMETFAPGPKIVLSKLREAAVPIGALALAENG